MRLLSVYKFLGFQQIRDVTTLCCCDKSQMLEVEGGPNQSSGTPIAKNGFSFNWQILLHFPAEVKASPICPSTDKENSADSGFVSATYQQDSFWSRVHNHNKLFAYVCTRSHIVPRSLGKTFTETKGTDSYQMLPITLLHYCNHKALNSETDMKISSRKEENESSYTQKKILTSQVGSNTFLIPSSEKAPYACEIPSLVV